MEARQVTTTSKGRIHVSSTPQDVNYEIGQDNIRPFGLDIHNPVFVVSAITIILFVLFVLAFQEGAAEMFGKLRPWLTTTFDWVFMGAANIFVLFCLLLIVTPLGKVRLGGADATPDYSYAGWFAMLFAAGMGIGLMFFGVLEPVYHFQNPPLGVNVADTEAARAIALLLGGGLASLQAASIATGFPFAIVLVAMAYSTFVGLKAEKR